MIVYHGSNVIVSEPKLIPQNRFLDFGFGIELPKYHSYLAFMNGEAYLGDGAVFALLGCAFFYYFAPRWNSLFMKLKKWMRISICILLTAIFVFDLLSGIIQY